MAYGFRIRTDSGIIQIDDTFANLAFIAKGSVTLSNEGSAVITQGIRYNSVTLGGRDIPILAVRSNDAPIGYRKVVNNGGGSWTWELCADGIYGANPVVDWYLFDRPPASGGYGIRIRDASNREVFNSNNRYFRPKMFNSLDASQPPNRGQSVDFTGLPLGTYAYVPATCRNAGFAFVYFNPDKAFWQMTDAAQNLSNGVRWGWAPISENPSYPGTEGWYTANATGYMTVVDVGGY